MQSEFRGRVGIAAVCEVFELEAVGHSVLPFEHIDALVVRALQARAGDFAKVLVVDGLVSPENFLVVLEHFHVSGLLGFWNE